MSKLRVVKLLNPATTIITDIRVSANDTTAGYLNGKLVSGTGITLTENNDGGNETLTVATTITQYTDELAQDAVGNAVGNGLDYDDGTGAISVDESELAHNSIGSLQGGQAAEYYHLTSAQHTIATQAASTTLSGYLTDTDWDTFNNKQPQLNGTGFVKATGTTISYDNSTYLTSVTPHDLLSATHGDTTASAVARGDLIVGTGATPKWDNLAIGTAGKALVSDGTDVSWSTSALGTAAFTAATAYEPAVTWGDGLEITGSTAAVDFNTTNLKITSTELNTIQDIATASSPTFANLTDSGLTATRVTYAGTAGILQDSANMTYDGTTETLVATSAGASTIPLSLHNASSNASTAVELRFGASSTPTTRYASIGAIQGGATNANWLDLIFKVSRAGAATERMRLTNLGQLLINNGTSTGGIVFGDASTTYDTNLYRSAANTLKTDDSLVVAGSTTTAGLTLSNASQNYIFGNRGTYLTLQSQNSAGLSALELYTKDGDGTDNVYFNMWAVGTPTALTNAEYVTFFYDSAATAFKINTEAIGTGTIRSLILQTNSANALEIDLNQKATFSGEVAMNGNTTLGNASTDTITHTGRAIFRTAASDPQHATPGSRPAGSVGEIAYYAGKMYFCTNAATPTWEKITST